MKQKIYPFLVLLTCFTVTGVAVTLYFSCGGIFYTPVCEYFGVSRGIYTLTGSVMGIAQAFAAPMWGKLLKKHSLKWMLLGVILTEALTYFCMSHFNSIWWFFLSGAIFGGIMGLLMILITPAIINRWFAKNKGLFTGLVSSMSGVGGVIINPIAGRMLANYGWQHAFSFYGFLVLCIPLPLVLFILRDYPEDIGIMPWGHEEGVAVTGASQEIKGLSFADVKKETAFKALVIYNVGCTLSNCFTGLLPSYGSSLGMDITKAAVLASFFSLGVLIGKNSVGTICDKNAKIGIAVATLGPAAGLFLMMVVANRIPGNLQLGAVLFGITYCGNTVLSPLLVRSIFGTKEESYITGQVSKPSQVIGSFLGPAFGFISEAKYGFIIIMAIALIANVTGFISCEYAYKQHDRIRARWDEDMPEIE